MLFARISQKLGEAYNQSEKIVRVDRALLKSRYDYWNMHLFDNALPKDISFTTSNTTSYLGQTKANVAMAKQASGQQEPLMVELKDLAIDISTHWRYTNKILDAVLLHEMAHVLFYSQGKPYEEHGAAFLSKLRELSARTGFKIPTKNDPEELPHLIDGPGQRVIALVRFKKDGKKSAALFTPSLNAKDLLAHWSSLVGDDILKAYDTTTVMARMLPVKSSIESGVFNFVEPDQFIDIQSGRLINP